jgi:hypothetical protein
MKNWEFKTTLGYIARSFLKKKKKDMKVKRVPIYGINITVLRGELDGRHTYNP